MTLPMGRPMRDVFGETVTALADDDPRIVMLDADLGSSTKGDIFENAHPERYLQMGIAEQNMLGVAAGLAVTGLVPFISTFVSFAVVRPLDQIRVLIGQPHLNVKITPGYAGLFTGMAGKTHQVVDDVSIMRTIPGMVTIAPADDIEAAQALRWAAAYDGPVYIRLVRDATARLFGPDHRFAMGSAIRVREGRDVALVSTGTQTPRTVEAADLLAADGIDALVLHVPTVKPLDVEALAGAAERAGIVITVEEHSILGGLGSAVAEALSERRPSRVHRIGLQDVYGESASNDALLDKYGLSPARVAEQVRRYLAGPD